MISIPELKRYDKCDNMDDDEYISTLVNEMDEPHTNIRSRIFWALENAHSPDDFYCLLVDMYSTRNPRLF